MVHGAVTFGPRARTGRRRNNETMRHRTQLPPVLDVDVTTHGRLPGAADYARTKVGGLGRFTHRPVLYARVKLTRHPDPAVERPVVAQANLDVDGRLVRVQVEGVTAREAIDRLEARLRHRLERTAEHWEALRGRAPAAGAREWRHQSEPTHRPGYFPRPVDERRVIRRKSFTLAPCTVDEAAVEMDLLDYDFHLFTEKGYRRRQCSLPRRSDGLPFGTSDTGVAGSAGPIPVAADHQPATGPMPYRRASH